MTVGEIRAALAQARVPSVSKMNIAQVLANAGHNVDTGESDGKGHRLWRLTSAGSETIRGLLGLPDEQPEIAMDVSSLRKVAAKLTDAVTQEYVQEAILCLSVGALRASIVFLWSGGMRQLQTRMATETWLKVNAAIQRHDPKAKAVSKIEDFAQIKDSTMLLAARDLAIIDKGQWTMLDAALGLRNQCGHPSRYSPGEKKASAFIEDIANIIFL
jgi:hypothetical protein